MPSIADTSAGWRAERRYDQVSIILHWLIAAMIVVQLCLGWYMNEVLPDHSAAQGQIRTVHISWGLTILILVLIRIAWRLVHWPPPLPPSMPVTERVLARVTHVLFYLLMLALPLTGWALVSLGGHPIYFWGLPWPHLPGAAQIFGAAPSRATRHALSHVHVFILIWIVVVTLALHVAGALWHQLHGPKVLWRMSWMKP